jgi:hypothetical protein
VKSRWAQGLEPRFFTWVIRDRLAVSERPGGYARNHRKVRREEEILWLRQQGFSQVMSLLDSPHNLHAYEVAGLPFSHVPLGRPSGYVQRLPEVYRAISASIAAPTDKVLLHHEDFGDTLVGVIAGYLVYLGFKPDGPQAITFVERLTGRQLGPEGRTLVAVTVDEGLRATAG